MELNALERSNHNRQRNGKHSKRSSCYSCGKPGHIARNCQQGQRDTNKVRRHINMIQLHEPSDNDEWEVIEASSGEQDDEEQGFSNKQDTQATIKDNHKNQESKDLPELRYQLDPRNPGHALLPWTMCYNDQCTTHKGKKLLNNVYPQKQCTCTKIWKKCKNDFCHEHLWDKREIHQYFPRHDRKWNRELCRTIHLALDNCLYSQWQTCLNDEYKEHLHDKTINGYSNTKPRPRTAH